MSKLDELIKDLNKEYKEEIAFKGDTAALIKYEKVPFSSPRINYMLYGGLPMGRMIEFAGAERSGKTTTALDMVKNCQEHFKKEGKGRKVCFVDAENTFDVEWAKTLGVNVEELILIKPQEQYAEELFDIMKSVVQTGEVGLLVLDSVAQLVSRQAMEGSIEQKTYGGIAMSLTKFCNIVVPLLGKYNCMCIMINQVREDLNNPYNQFITPGGRGFKHNCSVRLMFQKGKYIDVNNKELTNSASNPAGNLVMVSVEKSKVCRSDRRTGYYTLNYLEGIDYINDSIDVLMSMNIIEQRGAFFYIHFIDMETGEVTDYDGKIQGRSQLVQLLKENKELYDKLSAYLSYN